jgi:hypothetical protein
MLEFSNDGAAQIETPAAKRLALLTSAYAPTSVRGLGDVAGRAGVPPAITPYST